MRDVLYRKGMVIAIICLFIGAGILPITGAIKNFEKVNIVANPTFMDTITVDDEGDGDYTSIQEAINNANPGDTIEVYSGTYVENVVVDKQLTLVGNDTELGSGDDTGKPIIDGGGSGDVVKIIKDGVSFIGFKIIMSGESDEVGSIKINSNNNIVNNNSVSSHNAYGIYIWNSANNIVNYNEISDNRWGGIFLRGDSPNNILLNNSFLNNGIAIYPESGTLFYGDTLIIENNTVNGKPIYYIKNMDGGSVNPDAGQVILANCTNFEICNLNISNTDIGIQLLASCNNTICQNKIYSNNQEGIYLIQSSFNQIFDNNISKNWGGIALFYRSRDNTIQNNNITYNSGKFYTKYVPWQGGIVLVFSSTHNLIYENNLENNGYLFNVWDHCGGNNWDDGAHGNYYSDNWYKVDNNYDGISDIDYYIIDSTHLRVYQDNYPLMYPIGRQCEKTPPEMEIEKPMENYIHISDNDPSKHAPITIIMALPWQIPLNMKVYASDDSGIGDVVAYIDFDPKTPVPKYKKLEPTWPGSELYECKLSGLSLIGMHNLTFVAIDNCGNAASYSMDVFFFYFQRLTILD